MICGSRLVFRCFKCLERIGDRVTGAAGPYFVGLAVILISGGTICFFEVIAPNLPFRWITIPICCIIALNLFAHYYYACTIPPGCVEDPPREEGTGILWATRTKRTALTGVSWSDQLRITQASATTCRKCGQIKPEDTPLSYLQPLHSQVRSPLPRINQCVGLYNERHFVLFMVYLVLSTFCLAVSGYGYVLNALGLSYTNDWPYHIPAIIFILTYILSAVLCFAVGIMLAFHLWTISLGETSVEGQDHEIYRKVAKSRGEEFVNSYDVGIVRNLQLFFNIGKNGYPFYTVLLPLRIVPYTDGRSWARRPGYITHQGIRQGEELTDEEADE